MHVCLSQYAPMFKKPLPEGEEAITKEMQNHSIQNIRHFGSHGSKTQEPGKGILPKLVFLLGF